MCVTNVPSEPMTGPPSSPYGFATQTQQRVGERLYSVNRHRGGEEAETIKLNETDFDRTFQVLFIWEIPQQIYHWWSDHNTAEQTPPVGLHE